MAEKYVFAGNRAYILKNMLNKGLDLKAVWVMNGSFLHNMLLKDLFVGYTVIYNKEQLLAEIAKIEFDIFISNGCRHVLPVSKLKPAKYVNIHPSPLPDLRGRDPINAACLFDRPCGATCHLMDDGIDTGKVISQVVVPMTDDIDAAILYQLCFKAEVMAFEEAYQRHFEPMEHQPTAENPIYFSMKPEDRLIKFEKGLDYIIRQTKAFGYKSKGLYFSYKNRLYHFFRAEEVTNPFVLEYYKELSNLQIAMVFEDSVVVKMGDRMLRFDQVEKAYGEIREGDFLESAPDEMVVSMGQ